MPSAEGARKARQKRKEKLREGLGVRTKPGSLKDLQAVLWKAMTKLEEHMDKTAKRDTARLTKLTHALSQASATYIRVIEVGELEARVEALEKQAETGV